MASEAKGFPLPSSVKVAPGTEGAQAAYPYYMQFEPGDDQRFWFYNSMHFPEPMTVFDMVTAEAAYIALGASNTRVHSLPTTLGIDYRIINGRVYIGGNGVTDPDQIAKRVGEFQQRAFYYYEHWERLYDQWKGKMRKLIADAEALPKRELPDFEPLENVHAGKGVASNHVLLETWQEEPRGLLPDVAPTLRVPAARIWRLHGLLRLLQKGLPRDHRPDHRPYGGRLRCRDLPPGRGDQAPGPPRRGAGRRPPLPGRDQRRGRAGVAPRVGQCWRELAGRVGDLAPPLVQHPTRRRRRLPLPLPPVVAGRPHPALRRDARLHRQDPRQARTSTGPPKS